MLISPLRCLGLSAIKFAPGTRAGSSTVPFSQTITRSIAASCSFALPGALASLAVPLGLVTQLHLRIDMTPTFRRFQATILFWTR